MKCVSSGASRGRLLSCAFALALPFNVFATASEDYEKALDAFNSKQYEEAYIHLQNTLKEAPENLGAKILMGKILLINGYLTAAELEFTEALELGADINLVAEALGNTWLFMNKYEDIIAYSKTGQLTGKAQRDWLEIKATACIRTEDFMCAERTYEKLRTLAPDSVAALNGLASIAIQRKELNKAEQLLSTAMQQDDKNAVTWRLSGQLAYAHGDSNKAIEHLQTALSFNNQDPVVLRNLVDLYLQANDYDRAKSFVDQAIETTPNDPLAILLNSWLQSRNSDEVIDNAELQRLNQFLAELSPEMIASQPMLLYISGLTNFFNKNLEKATKDFSAYLQQQPDDLQAVLLLAQTYMLTGQDKPALTLLEKHYDALLDDLDAALMLGDLLIRQNRAFKAQTLANDLQQRYPESGQLQLFNIKLMAARGKQQQALDILDQNFDSNQDNPGFIFTYAILKLQSGDVDDAIKGANLLIDMFPEKVSVYNLKAGILIRQNKLSEAKALIQQALKIDPTFFPAKFNLAATQSRLGNIEASDLLVEELLTLSPKHMESMMLKAFNLSKRGQTEDAKSVYQEVLTLYPDAAMAREKLASLYVSEGDLDAATYQIDRLLKDDFDNPEYLLMKADFLLRQNKSADAQKTLGIAYNFVQDDAARLVQYSALALRMDNTKSALEALQRAKALRPDDLLLTLQLAKVLIISGNTENAEEILAELKNQGTDDPNLWLTQGLLRAAQGKDKLAVENYQRALKLDPNFSKPLVELYNYALRERFVDEFLAFARDITQTQPNNLFARSLLAQYLFFIREFDESSALYQALLNEDSIVNKAEILTRLALMSMENDLNTAAKYAKEAFALAPNDASVLDAYGWILAQQGELEQGLSRLREAYARDANNPNVRYHLGYTLAKLGRTDEARQELEFAVSVRRPFFRRPQAKALLDSLN
ncbi:XrtA/PEP-CTERM system TPR-repeat protein PrsT [Alteromonas halophila]|nr:XrtA/PEP-CTERM system TPR-repeat protein PrsT [Alteromonas halophila]